MEKIPLFMYEKCISHNEYYMTKVTFVNEQHEFWKKNLQQIFHSAPLKGHNVGWRRLCVALGTPVVKSTQQILFEQTRCENVFHHGMQLIQICLQYVCKFTYEKCFPRHSFGPQKLHLGFLTADCGSGRESHRSPTNDSNKHRLTRDSD